jgi:spore germination protein KB
MKEKISLWQLFILLFIFEGGSALVVGIGAEAKNDAWIAVLMATFIGIFIVLLYLFLIQKGENQNFFQLLEKCFGKWLGKMLIFIYILYFFYIGARVLRDFGELMVTTIFEQTPIEFISLSMMLLIAYILYLGVEVLARVSEIFIPYMALFIFFIAFGLQFSDEIEFTNLLPILGDGIGPVIKAVFPTLVTFPFGELIAFTLIFPLVSSNKIKMGTIVAVCISGIMLSFTAILQITTLGENIRSRSTYPMLSAAREISLLNFIERVDLLIVFIMMFGIIVKVAVWFYGGLLGLELIFKRPNRQFVLPMALLIAYFSIVISPNFTEHMVEGLKVVPLYFHIPFQLVIPLILMLFLLFRKNNTSSER